jgi:SSS family solute:Na+ symporter
MAGLVGGFVLGMAKLAAEVCKSSLEGTFLKWFVDINFLYFCLLLFAVSVVIIVAASLMTAKPSGVRIRSLTYATATVEDKALTRAGWNKWDVINSCIVLGIIIIVYSYFNG